MILSNVRISPHAFAGALILAVLIGFACENTADNIVIEPERLEAEAVFAINGNGIVTLGWMPLGPGLFKSAHGELPSGTGTPAAIEVHRSDDHDFTPYRGTLYATLPPEANRFADTALTNGAMYYYRILPVAEFPGGLRRYGIPSGVLVGRPYDYGTVGAIDYAEHIQPIFTSGCAVSGCHTGEDDDAHVGHFKPSEHAGPQFSLRSWEDLMRGSSHGAVVVPYRPLKSHLVFHLNTDTLVAPVSTPHMPLPGSVLPDDQLQTLIRWVSEGAYNEVGAVALSAYPEGRVMITNQGEDLVCIVDIAALLVSRYIQAGAANVFAEPPHAPHNMTVDKVRGVYYVNLVGAGRILKFRLADNALLGQVSGITSPTQIALSPGGDTGYVAQFARQRNAIRLFDTQSMTLLDSISSLNFERPHGIQISPDGRELWATGNSSDNLLVVNLADQSTELVQLNNQPPGSGFQLLPYQTVMTSDDRYVYVSCQQSNDVRVVDRATRSVVKSIPVGQWPLILAISPDNRFVYSANRNSNDVSVIRTSDNTVVATIPNVGPQPHGIDITANGRYAYVSCENVISLIPPHHPTSGSRRPGFLAVIDLQTNIVVKQIEVGAFASGVVVVE